jgi:hypothetical protein
MGVDWQNTNWLPDDSSNIPNSLESFDGIGNAEHTLKPKKRETLSIGSKIPHILHGEGTLG